MLIQTWFVPLHGYSVDRFGPRLMLSAAGIFVGAAWVLNSFARFSATALFGSGDRRPSALASFTGSRSGNASKVVSDRRGLAAGPTASGYGAGSALTVLPIQATIQTQGYEAAFF